MPSITRVLMVDEDTAMVAMLTSYLEREGFEVRHAPDGPSGIEVATGQRPDLLVVDTTLPGFGGIELCQRLRQFSDAYVIMLSSRDDEPDKIAALTAGADDYLMKPVSPRELLARIAAMMRRPRSTFASSKVARIGALRLDHESRRASLAGVPLDLTRTEFDLLAAMILRPGAALTRRQLIDEVWGPDWFGDEQVVDVHIGHVRRKLGDRAAAPRYIRTVRGVGYGLGTG